MFRGVRQSGFIPVLQSFGASPLEMWEMKVKNGSVRRVTDEQVRTLALEIAGTNVSTCYIYCPKSAKASLGIYMPYLTMIIKNLKKYFTFEVTILDDRNVHRRLRLSNFERMNRIHHFSTSMPLCLHPGWNEMYFDLADITRKAYKTNYVETTRIQIHANCRIRVIYFCDKIYKEEDIPQKLKIYLPVDHVSRKKSQESIPEKKAELVQSDHDKGSEYLEGVSEYGEEEQAYYEYSLKSEEGLIERSVDEKGGSFVNESMGSEVEKIIFDEVDDELKSRSAASPAPEEAPVEAKNEAEEEEQLLADEQDEQEAAEQQ